MAAGLHIGHGHRLLMINSLCRAVSPRCRARLRLHWGVALHAVVVLVHVACIAAHACITPRVCPARFVEFVVFLSPARVIPLLGFAVGMVDIVSLISKIGMASDVPDRDKAREWSELAEVIKTTPGRNCG